MLILSTAYLGNIQYYTKLLQGREAVVIERHENFVKQSGRNRCLILGADGVIPLIVPVHKTSGQKTPILQVRIDHSKRWQHQHWHSIHSAYKNSPYFDHYADTFERFYSQRFDYLWELNEALQQAIFGALGVQPAINYSDDYLREVVPEKDFRNAFSDKPRLQRPDPAFRPEPYYQVFSEKMEFVPNLSILDLLMCQGPATLEIIRRSTVSDEPRKASNGTIG
ncbi:MAG: WbqC family protein [Rikenellaceae bacterium]|jgi:hypothetical protein|nr:WbqC family protein [Rikenellaceae bacterium]